MKTTVCCGLLLASLAAMAQPAAQATAPAVAPAANSPTDPRGRWITASGNLEVEIARCGEALCGTVTRVLGNRSMTPGGGEMQPADARSPLGMQLLKDFSPRATDEAGRPPAEWRGEIYNRENGKTYRCTMSLSTAATPAGELLLHAYVGLPLFGKTQVWQRAPAATAVGRTAGTTAATTAATTPTTPAGAAIAASATR